MRQRHLEAARNVRRVEIVNIAEIKTQRPELRPDAKLRVDLRT